MKVIFYLYLDEGEKMIEIVIRCSWWIYFRT